MALEHAPERISQTAQGIARSLSRLVCTVHYTLLRYGIHLMFIAHLYDIVLDWPDPLRP
jgi:hypothetical protein